MGPKHRLPFSLKSPRKATSFTGNVLQIKHISLAFLCHTLGSVLKWASPVAHMVKNVAAIRETRVQSLGQEDPLGREWQPTPVFLPGEFHGQSSLAGYSPWGHKE